LLLPNKFIENHKVVLHKVAVSVAIKIPERFRLGMRQIVALYIELHKSFNIIQDYSADLFYQILLQLLIFSDHKRNNQLNLLMFLLIIAKPDTVT